jgi:glutathione peroxidase
VIRSGEQNPIYKWLTDAKQNGWNDEQPSWNFSKYLISEDGVLLNYFGPSVAPMSSSVTDAIARK